MKNATIKKSIQLTTNALEQMIAEEESIDFRLDEPAWEMLNAGDIIEFWEDFSGWDKGPSSNSRRVTVEIKDIVKAATFSELIDRLPNDFVRKENKEKTLSELRKWWTPEKEMETGVLGFKVKKINI